MWNAIHLAALAVTLGVEATGMVAYSGLRHFSASAVIRNGTIALATNFITHTFFWAILPYAPWHGLARLTILELLVTLIEAICYWRFCHIRLNHALPLSLLCNIASIAAGNMLWSSGLLL